MMLMCIVWVSALFPSPHELLTDSFSAVHAHVFRAPPPPEGTGTWQVLRIQLRLEAVLRLWYLSQITRHYLQKDFEDQKRMSLG